MKLINWISAAIISAMCVGVTFIFSAPIIYFSRMIAKGEIKTGVILIGVYLWVFMTIFSYQLIKKVKPAETEN